MSSVFDELSGSWSPRVRGPAALCCNQAFFLSSMNRGCISAVLRTTHGLYCCGMVPICPERITTSTSACSAQIGSSDFESSNRRRSGKFAKQWILIRRYKLCLQRALLLYIRYTACIFYDTNRPAGLTDDLFPHATSGSHMRLRERSPSSQREEAIAVSPGLLFGPVVEFITNAGDLHH